MPNIRLGAVLLSLTLLPGCLVEGAACQPENSGVCEDGSAALFCEAGTLVRYPCVGPNGCLTNSTTRGVLCDFTFSSVGAPCPAVALEQKIGFCAREGSVFVTCKRQADGRRDWSGQSCSSCTTTGGAAICNP